MEEKKHEHVCKFQKKLIRDHEECTPEQIKECHGDVREHPCVTEEQANR